MTVRLRILATAALLSTLLGTAAAAQNPKLSLKLENVTGHEAIAALSKASGVQLHLPDARFGLDRIEESLKSRFSFDWSSIRFAGALRQLCAAYMLRFQRQPGGTYTMYSSVGAPALPADRVGLSERNGVRLWVTRVSVREEREINFEGGFGGGPGNMSLFLRGEIPDGDAETFAGLANVTAKDELGNLLISPPPPPRGLLRPEGPAGYPDEFGSYVTLPPPHPKARKLVWVEGDILTHRVVRGHTIEIPLPIPETGAVKEYPGVRARVMRLERLPDEPGDNLLTQDRIAVEARLIIEGASGLNPRGSLGGLALKGVSGRLYTYGGGGVSGGGGAHERTHTMNLTFPNVAEEVAAVVFSLVEKSEPERLTSFRLTDVPLPTAAFLPQQAARAVPRPAAPKPDRPFHLEGGGTLVTRVTLSGQPAPEGILFVGLAAREGQDFGPVRWTEVDVGTDGIARLPDLQPGTYRLLRTYRTKDAPKVRADGVWQNAELTVEISAGKETTPPPLVWGPTPAGR